MVDGGRAMATPHIRHVGAPTELIDHSLERGQPRRREVSLVARAEELLNAAEHPVMVGAPGKRPRPLKGVKNLVEVHEA